MLLRVEYQVKKLSIERVDMTMDSLNKIIKKKHSIFFNAKRESYKLVNMYNGHIIQRLEFIDCSVKLPVKLETYFKLKDIDIKIEYKELYVNKSSSYKFNNCSTFIFGCNVIYDYYSNIVSAIYDDILTLKEYQMIMEYIRSNYSNKYRVTYEGIVFDNIENCNGFIEHLKNVYKINANIIKIS